MSGGLSCRSSVYKLNLLRLEYAYMQLHMLYTYIYMVIRGTNPIFVVSIAVVLFVMRDLDYHLPSEPKTTKNEGFTLPIHGL